MPTVTPRTPAPATLPGTRKGVYPLPGAMLRIGTRGKAAPAGLVYGSMARGQARRLRKQLHRAGYAAHAAAPRTATGGA